MNKIVEVCCGSYYDCLQAYKGNADRVELNSALYMGGLTPTVASLILTKKNTNLKVICMVRPRGAGFCYDKEDYETILLDVKSMMENGADGIAFGCLDSEGNIDISKTKEVIEIVKSYGKDKEVVFHRAFDCVNNPYDSMEILIDLGVDRVLTSGLEEKAIYGIKLLKDLQKKYGDRIEILAGSGMNSENAREFMESTGITQVHSSCKTWLKDKTTTKNNVSYAYSDDEYGYDVVDCNLVKELVKVIKE
ncbi:copper homeostasis protein CutC [Eubacterium multiforme]|uniref:PF03932 family protein CutC n=1 Tax=Eubacterium multiforme TaxID=83339 RepID=A0ABT9UW96_9FIRM|nr:copper homeostasis protein [Eubacterium multiforme]